MGISTDCNLLTIRNIMLDHSGLFLDNVHYGDDAHFVVGDRGASEWTLSGTTTEGETLEVRGCDLWTFRDGLVTRKDTFWKIVEPPVKR